MSADRPCFEISHDVVLVVDGERRVVAANPECARVLGYAAGELDGQPVTDLVHPDDRARFAGQIAPGGQVSTELRLRARGGQFVHLSVRAGPGAAPGELYLSAREQSSTALADLARVRRDLSALFECTQDYVIMTDADINITYANREPEEIKRMGGMTGKPMLMFAAPEEAEPMAARVDHVMKTGELVVYDTRSKFPDGSLHDFTSRLAPIRDGARVVGVVLITRETTAERRMEEAKRHAEAQLREYMTQLERSNAELERFASIASHDLQEPLRKIQAFSDRLRDKFMVELPDTGRDYLERIRSAAKRMQDLINDLLMFSRLSAREQTYGRVNLAKVAKSVLSDLEVRIEETGGKVVVGELPTIEADPVHMRQLLQNLIGNALKFTRPDVPPVVELSAEVVPLPGGDPSEPGFIRLRVADNGIGIEPRHHDRIFGIFERLHGRGKYEGTGVGLAVCRKIVEQHNGSIQLTSTVGEGTTFVIMLPARQGERSKK